MKKVTHETEEGDMLYAVAYGATEELDKAQNDQDRLRDEMEVTCESMVAASKEYTTRSANLDGAFRKVNCCRALHMEACAGLKKACQRTAKLKRKATDAHDKTRSHRTLQKSNQGTDKIRSSREPQSGVDGV